MTGPPRHLEWTVGAYSDARTWPPPDIPDPGPWPTCRCGQPADLYVIAQRMETLIPADDDHGGEATDPLPVGEPWIDGGLCLDCGLPDGASPPLNDTAIETLRRLRSDPTSPSWRPTEGQERNR